MPGDIIILNMCTINNDHMMYGSWNIKWNGQIFLSFWTIFCLFTPLITQKIKILKNWDIIILHVYHKWKSYYVWFLRYRAWQTEFFVILDHFLPFYPPKKPQNQNFENMKKTPEDIIILCKCTKNHDHMLFCSWDMICDRCNYFSFWAIFYLYPSNSLKNENFKQIKKRLEISFYTSAPKIMII